MLQTIPHQQILDRFDILPERLRDAILSSGTSDEVWRIGQLSHLNEDKIFRLARIVGRVLMGFIDADDVAREIKEYVNIPAELSGSLARDLQRKIFTYYEADIAKAYAPEESIGTENGAAIQKPAELQHVEIRKEAEAAVRAMPIPATKAPSPMPMPRPMNEPALIPPTRITEHTTQTTAQNIPASPMPTTTLSAPAAPTPHAGRMEPFILHKEEKVRQINEMKPIDISFTQPESKRPAEKPLIAAELELGKEEETKKEPIIGKTPEQTQRVVHYSDFRTPINPFEKRVAPAQSAPTPATTQPVQTIPAPMPKAPTPPPVPMAPIQAEQTIKPAPIVKMEGNVLDLRQKP